MSTLSSLKSKVKSFKQNLESTISSTEKDIREAEELLNSEIKTNRDVKKEKKIAQNIKSKKINLRESIPMGSFEYLRKLVRDAINKTTVFNVQKSDGVISEPYPYIKYTFLTHVIVEVNEKFYDLPFVLSTDNTFVVLGVATEVEEIFIAKESDVYFQEARGDGQGSGGSKQGDGGADKCVCPKCGKKYTHVKGAPCSKQICPTCKVALVGKDVGVKESKSFETEISEAGIKIISSSLHEKDINVAEFISLKESKFDAENGTVEIVIIEAGFNEQKKRLYPDATVRESAGIFAGMKMYIDHPTKKDAIERPERSIKDWASTLTESHYENGKAIGTVAVHDAWLRERLADPVAREQIGISILAGGKASFGKRNGQNIEIVEKIIPQRRNGPASVDWVTEAGARGRVSRLLKETNQGGNGMEIKEATFVDIERENPDLIKSIVDKVKVDLKESTETKQKDLDLKEAQDKVVKFEKKEKVLSQKSAVEKLLKESTLPEIAKERIVNELKETVFEGEDELKESVSGRIKSELAYLNKLSLKGKINFKGEEKEGGKTTLKESLSFDLEKRLGIKQEEKKEDK